MRIEDEIYMEDRTMIYHDTHIIVLLERDGPWRYGRRFAYDSYEKRNMKKIHTRP